MAKKETHTIEMEVNSMMKASEALPITPIGYTFNLLAELLETASSIKIIIERDEEKTLELTNSDFEDIINVVSEYAHPEAELRSRLENGKYKKNK